MKSPMNQQQSTITIEDYTLSQELGAGQYGKVYKGYNARKNNFYAVKVVKNTKFIMDPKLEEFTMNEIQALARIKNDNVIQFIEMIRTSNHYYFVYEFCNGGDLEGMLQKKGKLAEMEAYSIFKQIVKAFTSLVKENIMHRDLKPANVLFHNGTAKLADFGFCKALGQRDELTASMVGSPIYMAPEVLLGKQYSQKADIWSLGCVFYEMLFGLCPYETNSMGALIKMVEEEEVQYPVAGTGISQRTVDLLKRIFVKDVEKRIGWEDLFNLVLNQDEQIVQYKDQSPNHTPKSNSNSYLYLIQERNKIKFLMDSLQEILEYNFGSKNLAVVIYLYAKYLCQVSGILKMYIVENFDASKFKNMQNTNENWNKLRDSFEFKTYCRIVNKEYEHVMQMLPIFKAQCEKYKDQSIYNDSPELQQDFDSPLLHESLLQKVVIDYGEEIKNQFFNKMIDQGYDEEMKKWLIHIAKLYDSLLIDEIFKNLMMLEQTDLHRQQYYTMLYQSSKQDLLKLITSKAEYLRRKKRKI